MEEKAKEEQEYTEQYAGIIMLRKARFQDKDVWFGTVGSQLVSDGIFEDKKKLVENLNKITLERVSKMIAGAFKRAIEHREGKA